MSKLHKHDLGITVEHVEGTRKWPVEVAMGGMDDDIYNLNFREARALRDGLKKAIRKAEKATA